jgi:hypothetical protein
VVGRRSFAGNPGARFKGWNRFGWMRWSMPCEVRTAVADQELSFSTMAHGKQLVTWSYRINPSDGGVDLVESFDVHWLPLSARIAEDFLMRDRDRRRAESMRKTLEGIKQLAEDGSGS